LVQGCNVVVALLCYEGNSVVVNKAALDRGLFRRFEYVTKYADGKTYAVGEDAGAGWKVDSLYRTKKGKTKVRLKRCRPFDMGTVVGTRTGVKAVCSSILEERDLPFTEDGVVPDLILNPLAVHPALLLEGLFGKVHSKRGSIGDGTAFSGVLNDPARQRDAVLLDGKTGAVYRSKVFTAPLFCFCGDEPAPTTDISEETGAMMGLGLTVPVETVPVKIDLATGTPALCNEELGVTLAPELDGPLEFDGQLRPTTTRKHLNAFTTVDVPKAFRDTMMQAKLLNVQMRLLTDSGETWATVEAEQKPASFSALRSEPFSALDNTYGVYDSPSECPNTRVLFPAVETKDFLARVLLSSLDVEPAADLKRARYNQDKLDLDCYANMDWRSARNALMFCFKKANRGVFVRIRRNRVANFLPVRNSGFTNDFSDRLSLDGKEAAQLNALDGLLPHRPTKWTACGNVVDDARREEEMKLVQLYDMLVNTCSRTVVHDCMFMLNPTDFPLMGVDQHEANAFVYGPAKKMDSAWTKRSYIPFLSMCTSAKHADLPVPTSDDWEVITQRYYAEVHRGKVRCRNRYILQDVTPWANRTASVAKSEDAPGQTLPVFYWRGVVHGDDHHPRRLLAQAAARYAKPKLGAAIKPGVLDAAAIEGELLRLSYVAEHNLVLVKDKNINKEKTQDKPDFDVVKHSHSYKFAFNVENIGASYKLGVLFKLGFCVLHVETPYQLWFERLVDTDGKPLLSGGDVENYEEGWCFLSVKRDLSNLERTVQWCVDNDDKCRRIADRGKQFFATYFTRQYVYEYWAATMNAVSARQKVVDRTVTEEQSYMKELTAAYHTLEAKIAPLKRHAYEVAQPQLLKTTVVVVAYKGKEHLLALQQCLKHLNKCSVLLLEQTEGLFNRGALMNAAYLFAVQNLPEVDTFVFIDPEAVFTSDFAQRYFGNDGKDVVDLGKSVDAPLGWAVKCSKDVYAKINGFPNSMPNGGGLEAFENRLRQHQIPVYAPAQSAGSFATPQDQNKNKDKKMDKEDSRAAVVLDALQHSVDGVNSLQFVVAHSKSHPRLKHVRLLSVRLVPETQLEDLEKPVVKPVVQLEVAAKPLEVTGGSDTMDEPHHLKTIELAYVHHMDVPSGGSNVVHVLDDEVGPSEEPLPFLESAEVMPTENLNTVKRVQFNS
jgi:hypothetical protein